MGHVETRKAGRCRCLMSSRSGKCRGIPRFVVGYLMSEREPMLERLIELCDVHELGVEDWSTVRFICAECSRGNVGQDDCKARKTEDGTARFGLAARRREELVSVLENWAANENAGYSEVE